MPGFTGAKGDKGEPGLAPPPGSKGERGIPGNLLKYLLNIKYTFIEYYITLNIYSMILHN